MIGQIRCFLPTFRRGVIQTDTGEMVPFCLGDFSMNLQGGDIVEFDPVPENRSPVSRVRLRQRWIDKLSREFRPLVNQLYSTVRFRS